MFEGGLRDSVISPQQTTPLDLAGSHAVKETGFEWSAADLENADFE